MSSYGLSGRVSVLIEEELKDSGDLHVGENNIYVVAQNVFGDNIELGESIGEFVISHSFIEGERNAVLRAVLNTGSS